MIDFVGLASLTSVRWVVKALAGFRCQTRPARWVVFFACSRRRRCVPMTSRHCACRSMCSRHSTSLSKSRLTAKAPIGSSSIPPDYAHQQDRQRCGRFRQGFSKKPSSPFSAPWAAGQAQDADSRRRRGAGERSRAWSLDHLHRGRDFQRVRADRRHRRLLLLRPLSA